MLGSGMRPGESTAAVRGWRWLAAALGSAALFGPLLGLSWSGDLSLGATQAPPVRRQPAAARELGEPSAAFSQRLAHALALLNQGKPGDSLPLLERCREERPDDFAVHNNLCVAYGMLERRNEAVVACRRALALESNKLARSNLAWVSRITPAKR